MWNKKPQRGDNSLFHREVTLNDLDILKYNQEQKINLKNEMDYPPVKIPIDSEGRWKNIHIWKLKSVYINKENKESVFYHLHPELVHINEEKEKCTYLCNECYRQIIENEEIPELSIAAGIDFGHYKRIGLTFPNTFERTILALVRLYHKIMKISQNDHQTSDYTHSRIRGH